MTDLALHRPDWVGPRGPSMRSLLQHEWLVTNGIGGYASGTVAELMTRKYHGYLVASLPAPLGRMVMLQDLGVTVRFPDGHEVSLSGEERSTLTHVPSERILADFRLEHGMPVWEFDIEGIHFEKRLLMPYGQNTTYVSFRLLEGSAPCIVTLRPFIHFRSYEGAVTTKHGELHCKQLADDALELRANGDLPALQLRGPGSTFKSEERWLGEVAYRVERDRGYEWLGEVWSPGVMEFSLASDSPVTLIASSEPETSFAQVSFDDALALEITRRNTLLGIAHSDDDTVLQALTLAADQFIITPVGRPEDAARARAAGDESRTVIAGYHWFTDWGRDTMISLEGLTLCTGRYREAGCILRTFAHYVRDGLIPNMFPDGANEGLYHTADASMWFFHAVHRYVTATGDRHTLTKILPRLREVIDCHIAGTRFGIGMDPDDALLRQGAEGYQLTWMDAKVDGWVVTPRRGKAVEINALWYNAIRLMTGFERDVGDAARAATLDALAQRIRTSFNARFWNDADGYLFDVVDVDGGTASDNACRPNQVFAISLDNPVLDETRWASVLEAVRTKLLTPVGLRSLAPGHPDYKSRYFGDLRARDAAYHQGTVWGWLIGPYVDASLRVHPDDVAGARSALEGLVNHLDDFGVGSIAEVFDAEAPYTPRGCIAQAWSVAEVLRCWRKTAVKDGRARG